MSVSDRFYSGLTSFREALPLTALGAAVTYGAFKFAQLSEYIGEAIQSNFDVQIVDQPWRHYEGVVLAGGLTVGYLIYRIAHGILNPGERSDPAD